MVSLPTVTSMMSMVLMDLARLPWPTSCHKISFMSSLSQTFLCTEYQSVLLLVAVRSRPYPVWLAVPAVLNEHVASRELPEVCDLAQVEDRGLLDGFWWER